MIAKLLIVEVKYEGEGSNQDVTADKTKILEVLNVHVKSRDKAFDIALDLEQKYSIKYNREVMIVLDK